jgi:polar amino acid transport system permease protein
VFRGLPALLTIVFVGFGLPIALDVRVPGTYGPGSLALAIVAGAYIAETIRAGIEAVPDGQMEAARSLGMSHGRAMVSIVIPQAFRIIIPPLTNEAVLLLKDTSLLAVLGVTSRTEELTQFARSETGSTANATPMMVAGLVYLALTIPLTQVASLLERRGRRSR